MLSCAFIYNKSNTFGLASDVSVLKEAFGSRHTIKTVDPLEPPFFCDVAVHFEVPSYVWMSFAASNIIIVNPEWWEEEWNSYLKKTDVLVFKCNEDMKRFAETHEFLGKYLSLPWTTPVKPEDFKNMVKTKELLWLLGGSVNKRAAAEHIIPLWKPTWPRLNVFTTTDISGLVVPPGVLLKVGEIDRSRIKMLQAIHGGHLIFSASEALSLVAMEGLAAGSFLIGNQLPTYKESFTNKISSLTQSTLVPLKAGLKDTFETMSADVLEESINLFLKSDSILVRRDAHLASKKRMSSFCSEVQEMIKGLTFKGKKFPHLDELPNISIVTLLYNRRAFVDLAFHNLLITDYPKDKIEWVVVEDSTETQEQASDKILKFGRECAPMSVSYIPMPKKASIGKKRNLGVERSQHDIILFMDDDDHYPSSSIRRRVTSLLSHPWKPQAVCCTTIACYDLMRGTSAVNTPPYQLGLSKRVSEATLCFHKSFWVAKPFPRIMVAEGEGFLEGREDQVLEIPTQQIIVAMSHSKNSTSRRIPHGPSGKPSCFWGFPKEMLTFLHKLVDVEIE